MTKEEIQQLLDHSIRTKGAQSEEALEFSSMLQFHNLGWQCEYAMNEQEDKSFLGRKDFTEVVLDKYLLPKLEDLVQKFDEIVSPMWKEVGLLKNKNNNLINTRDYLLPKLISGKVDVSDLDIDTGILDD